jgi:hypothetical protein
VAKKKMPPAFLANIKKKAGAKKGKAVKASTKKVVAKAKRAPKKKKH